MTIRNNQEDLAKLCTARKGFHPVSLELCHFIQAPVPRRCLALYLPRGLVSALVWVYISHWDFFGKHFNSSCTITRTKNEDVFPPVQL